MKTKLFMVVSALMLMVFVANAQRGNNRGGKHYNGNRGSNKGYYTSSNYSNGYHYNNCGNHYKNYNRGYTVTYGYCGPRYYGWSFYYHPAYRVWVEGYWTITQDSVRVWIPGYWRWIRY